MKKKYVITGITVFLFIAAGICYSCTYKRDNDAVLLTSGSNTGDNTTGNNGAGNNSDAGSNTGKTSPGNSNAGSSAKDASPGKSGVNGGTSDTGSSGGNAQTLSAGDDLLSPSSAEASAALESAIYAHICGAVADPGVYKIAEGSRLIELIEAAGGFTDDAAQDYVNQAQIVTDGQRIYIPEQEELKTMTADELIQGGGSTAAGQPEAESTLVNINTADEEELMSLPGIGKAKAAAILSYRKENGNFKSIEDLMKIPGIKEGLFHQISSGITVK